MVSRAKLAFTVPHPDGFSPSTSQALEQRAAMWFWMLVAVSMGLDDKKCTVKPDSGGYAPDCMCEGALQQKRSN